MSKHPQNTNADAEQLRRVLEQSSIFGDLSTELISSLVTKMQVTLVRGGDKVITQGAESNSMMIVVSGRLITIYQQPDGTRKKLMEITPGSNVGEVGLVLNQPRSADVLAIRDSSIATLNREDFQQILKQHPIELNQAIARRIFEYSNIMPKKPPCSGATAYTVIPLDKRLNSQQFCQQLKQALAHHGSVHLYTAEHGERLHKDIKATTQSNLEISTLEQQHDALIYECSDYHTPWSQMAARQADKIIFLVCPDTNPKDIDQTANLFNIAGFEIVSKSMVVLHPQNTQTPKVNLAWYSNVELKRIYPVRENNSEDHQRLARFLTDNAVGLVLGGGGARGFAHVGVLKALQEANIPVDMICGNSMGALIAAQYANGTKIEQLTETTKDFAKGGERPTIPIHSIFGGNRVRRDLQKMFATARFENQWIQTFVVSCNLSQATIHIHNSGPMWEGVLASNSPAAIAPPVIHNGEFLVDAALLDNVPVESMRQTLGFGKVIAVDVDVKNELKVAQSITKVNPWKLLWQRLFVKDAQHIPGIFEILNRSGHLGGLATREASKTMADHYLQPPVSTFSLMGYSKGDQIAEKGYVYTKQEIAKWHKK